MRCRWRASTSPSAITLDVFLPDMLGWTVLNQLKHDPATRHIPVQVLTVEEERQYGLERGAFSFMTKPSTIEGLQSVFTRIQEFIAPRVRELLVIEDDSAEQMSIAALIGASDIRISTRRQRRARRSSCCATQKFDCVILDLKLPDISGLRTAVGDPARRTPARHPDRGVHRARAHARKKKPSCASAPRASC